jgi:hypothetical protein
MKITGLVVAGVVALAVFTVFVSVIFAPVGVVQKTVDPDHIISNYEEFQNIYNTCQKLNADIGTIRDVPDTDKMFEAFSKSSMVAAKKQQMTRWVEEYNAKSKMLNRNLWKSRTLPYQLSVSDFSNY